MGSVNVVELKAMQKAAAQAHQDAIAAAKYALAYHAAYAPALKTNKAALDLFEAVQKWVQATIEALAADPSTDQSWFPFLAPYASTAHAAIAEIITTRNALYADMAAHFTLTPAEIAAAPFKAAAAVDAAAKSPPATPHLSPATPNAQTPSAQSPEHPPEDVPPIPDSETSPWTIAAVLAAAALALRWIFG